MVVKEGRPRGVLVQSGVAMSGPGHSVCIVLQPQGTGETECLCWTLGPLVGYMWQDPRIMAWLSALSLGLKTVAFHFEPWV